MRTHATTARRAGAAALAAAVLAGCASFSPDGGFGPVAGAVREHTGREAAWARTETEREALEARASALLAKGPLSADDAVQVALFNNRGLQAQLAELGLAEADLVQAARLPNPRFTLHRVSDDHHYALERSISFNILSLVTLPLATEVEKRRFEGARQRAAMDVLRLAADTRKAWIDAVAAEEAVRYLRRVRLAADAGAELAARMAKAVHEDSGAVMPVCAWVDGEYGLSGAYLGVEAEIGAGGIRRIVETDLTEAEKALLVEAYEAVKAKQADVKDL